MSKKIFQNLEFLENQEFNSCMIKNRSQESISDRKGSKTITSQEKEKL